MTTAGPAAAAAAEAGDFSVILCSCCRIRVYGVDARHAHYKSDLHRVNLKRKLLSVAPLSAEKFEKLLAEKKAEDAAKEALANSKRRVGYHCRTCSKRFSSVKALENHNKSRRHIDAEKARPISEITGTDDERSLVTTEDESSAVEDNITEPSKDQPESEDSDTESLSTANAIPPNVCVFNGRELESVEANAAYMAAHFGFFIPYVEHLVDLEGLLTYLGQKVGIGNLCIECDRAFVSLEAVRQHMHDKEHCRMTDDDDIWVEEYAEFYDFSGGDDDEESEGWVEVPEGEIVEGVEVPSNVVTVTGDGRGVKSTLTTFEPVVAPCDVDDDHLVEDSELVVNGKVLGHRSLNRYYKQSYGRRPNEDSMMVRRVMSEYRLLGQKRSNQPSKEVRAAARMQQAQRRRFDLKVGTSNYYTRKSAIKPSMAVFNSGYRP